MMRPETAFLTAVAMILGNAYFVAAEFGLISARRSSIELRALGGSRAAKITLGAMENVGLMLAGAQLGVTLCSLILGAVGEPLFEWLLQTPFSYTGLSDQWLHYVSWTAALAVMVYFHVVLGEMVPKNLALAGADRAALILTPPLVVLVRIFQPVVKALNWMATTVVRLLGVKPLPEVASTFTRDEVAGFVKESRREGLLSQDEEQLISGALEFDERTVQAVLVPLRKLVSIAPQVTPAEVEQLSVTTGFSRFPVMNKRGELVGYLHLKDILAVDEKHHDQPIPASDFRPLVSVKPRSSLRSALLEMQRSGTHMAQVKDAKGRVQGIIMLEDVLEELVGEIRDDARLRAPKTAD
jgi:CBS domain containing-hemolysin-like protein